MENWPTTVTALACLRCHRKTAYTGLAYTTEAYCLTALRTGSHFQQRSYLEETLPNCQTATSFLPSWQRGGWDRETDSSIFFYDLPPALLDWGSALTTFVKAEFPSTEKIGQRLQYTNLDDKGAAFAPVFWRGTWYLRNHYLGFSMPPWLLDIRVPDLICLTLPVTKPRRT